MYVFIKYNQRIKRINNIQDIAKKIPLVTNEHREYSCKRVS